jgi:membrane protein DedA with SNARE-associated domain
MEQKKNTVKNSYQIAVIIGVLGLLLYGYVLYNKIRISQYEHIFGYIAIEVAWLLITVYWWLQWRKIKRQEENK